MRPRGSELFPDFQLLSLAPVDGSDNDVDVPVISEGRAPDPSNPHEVALNADFASDLAVGPGATLPLESMTFEWIEEAYQGGDPGAPDGPAMDVTVTGIARTAAEFGRYPAVMHLTPAFFERYGDQMRHHDFVNARLTTAAFEAGSEGRLEIPVDTEIGPSPFIDSESTEDGLDAIAISLRLVGGVAAGAGLLALAMAIARTARASFDDRATLTALGWARSDHVRALALVVAPWLVAGAAVGVAGGLLLSPRATVGLARAIDPAPGSVIAERALVLMAVALTALAVLVLLALAAALARSRRRAVPPLRAGGTPLGRPLSLAIGVRHALFGLPDRGGRASRGAIAAMTFAVTAVLAALVVSGSIDRLRDDPALYGQGGNGRSVEGGESVEAFDQALSMLEDDGRVEDLVPFHIAFGVAAGDVRELSTLIFDVRRGNLHASLTAGRLPAGADEVALGPETLEVTGTDVGDEIELVAEDAEPVRYRIVGAVLFPEGDFSHDEGAALTISGGERLLGADPHDAAQLHLIEFTWRNDVDALAADDELGARGLTVFSEGGLVPGTVANLARVGHLPRWLALFVALLALMTLLHATWVNVGARRRELATLRALGVTRRTVSTIVCGHTLVIVVVAFAIGVPLGIAAGRQVWRPIAEGAHVVVRSVVPWGWGALALGGLVLGGVAAAALAATRAARQHPAAVLRSE